MVDQLRIGLPLGIVTGLDRFLQRAHYIRVICMFFAAMDELEQAALLNRFARVPGLLAQQILILLEVDKADTLHAVGGAGKTQLDHLFVQTDGFK